MSIYENGMFVCYKHTVGGGFKYKYNIILFCEFEQETFYTLLKEILGVRNSNKKKRKSLRI